MKDATTQGTATFQRANRMITEVGTFQSIAVAAKARGLNTGNLNQKKTDLAALKGTIAEKSTQVQQKIEAFNTAQSSLGEQSEEQKTAVQQAQQVKDQLGKANSDLDQAAQALDFGLEQSKMKDENQQGKALSQPVLHMLNSPAGELFIEAVAQVNKGAGGQSIEIADDQVARSEAGKKLRAGDGDSAADIIGGLAEKTSVGLGAIGAANGFISSGTELDEAVKGEDNVSGASSGAADFSSGVSAVTDTASALVGTVGGVIESKQLHDQEKSREDKIKQMKLKSAAAGKLKSADHVARTANAGTWIGTASDYVSAGNSIGGIAKGEDYDETKGNVASVVGDSLSVTGDVLGLAADSQTAKVQHEQDVRAKQNMKNLGTQLQSTIHGDTGRSEVLQMICNRLKEANFNNKRQKFRMLDLIDAALDGRHPSTPRTRNGGNQGNQSNQANQGNQANQSNQSNQSNQANQGNQTSQPNQPAVDYAKPDLEEKQRMLLLSLRMLEVGRENSKEAASDSRWDAAFDVLGTVGDLTSLAASITRMAGGKLGGAIVGLVANAIGAVGTVRDVVKTVRDSKDGGKGEQDQRMKKMRVFRGAMWQMAMLPPLSYGALQAAAKTGINVSDDTANTAEQYAAVFSSLEAANVNMVDFLYAIQKGNFGGTDALGNTLSVKQSLENTYNAMEL